MFSVVVGGMSHLGEELNLKFSTALCLDVPELTSSERSLKDTEETVDWK